MSYGHKYKGGIGMSSDIIQFMHNFLESSHIPVHYFTESMQEEDYHEFIQNFDLGLRYHVLGTADHSERFRQWLFSRIPYVIYIEKDIFLCTYIILFLPEKQEWLFCGPVLFEEITEKRLSALAADLDLPEEFHASLKYHYERIPFFSSMDLLKSMFFEFGNMIYGKGRFDIEYRDSTELEIWHYDYKNYLRIPEKPFHNIHVIEARYEAENALIDAVCSCNEAAAAEALATVHAYLLPQRLPDRLRDMKDYTITFNTLLRKATERAGVHPIHIDAHSNGTIPRIEQLGSVSQCIAFSKKMIHEYCELIRRHSLQNYSVIIRKALTYINTDLCTDLTLNVLAEQLNVNASYLSMLFKKEVGVTLTDYVNKHRIKHAGRLLLCTNLPIKSIAQKCGISDIYYFTRLFKRIMGTTPKAFRQSAPYEAHSDLRPAKSNKEL